MKETTPNPCTICPGYCCSRNVINICGYDAWVIARALDIRPTDFLAFADLGGNEPYNFRLDGSERSYQLALNMKEYPDGSRRCIFGLSLPRQQFRCGIYTLRPITCRGYPFTLEEGELTIKPGAFCPENTWNLDELDHPSLKEQLGRFQMEFCIYGLVVISWNRQVARKPRLEELSFRPFVDYLMDVYGSLEPTRMAVPPDAWPAIWNWWAELISNGTNPLGLGGMKSEPSPVCEQWLQDIHRVVKDSVNRTFLYEKMTDKERTAAVCCV